MRVTNKNTFYYKKVSAKDTSLLDQKTKKIFLYDLPTKILSISKMELNGRHPEGEKVLLEKDCSFVMYVTKGTGKYLINGEEVIVIKGDAVFVRAGSTIVAEGKFEYVTVCVPAFHEGSVEEVGK
jgi:mannose-6-phosphate isomerase-like protein (cupin superfamily)